MSKKFKAGDRVKCIIVRDSGLTFNKEYDVFAVAADGSVRLYGVEGFYHRDLFALINSSNIPTGCKPFNYEEAKQNLKNICNEFGVDDIIKSIHKVHNSDMFVAVDNEDDYHLFYMDGTAVHEGTASLFLLKNETVVYVNVYEGKENLFGLECKSIEEAKTRKGEGPVYISKITKLRTELKTETVHTY